MTLTNPIARRYIQHPPAGDAADLFGANQPGGAGRFQTVLANNAIWLQLINPCRPLATHPGFGGFTAPAVTGISIAPGVEDIPWNAQQGKVDHGANASLGLHYAWPYYTGAIPTIKVTSRAKVSSGATMGWIVVATSGRQRFGTASAAQNGIVTSTSFVDLVTEIPLGSAYNTSGGAAPQCNPQPIQYSAASAGSVGPSETGTLFSFSLFVGAYVTSPGTADWLGIAAYLVPQVPP